MRTIVSPELKNEMKLNQDKFSASLNLQPSDTALFLNGIFFDMDVVDIMTILESVRQEMRVLEGLHATGKNFFCTKLLDFMISIKLLLLI